MNAFPFADENEENDLIHLAQISLWLCEISWICITMHYDECQVSEMLHI